MKNILPRVILGLVFALCVTTARAEDYECENDDGCIAYTGGEGSLREVSFRRGDLVSSEGGWTLHPDDGWAEVD